MPTLLLSDSNRYKHLNSIISVLITFYPNNHFSFLCHDTGTDFWRFQFYVHQETFKIIEKFLDSLLDV